MHIFSGKPMHNTRGLVSCSVRGPSLLPQKKKKGARKEGEESKTGVARAENASKQQQEAKPATKSKRADSGEWGDFQSATPAPGTEQKTEKKTESRCQLVSETGRAEVEEKQKQQAPCTPPVSTEAWRALTLPLLKLSLTTPGPLLSLCLCLCLPHTRPLPRSPGPGLPLPLSLPRTSPRSHPGPNC